jgi:hypothetical protein
MGPGIIIPPYLSSYHLLLLRFKIDKDQFIAVPFEANANDAAKRTL